MRGRALHCVGVLAWIAASLPQGSMPAESVIRISLPVLLFSIALACATALAFGLSPALQLSRPDIAALMQSSIRRVVGAVHGRRSHNVLIAAQIALTVMLLASASAAASPAPTAGPSCARPRLPRCAPCRTPRSR